MDSIPLNFLTLYADLQQQLERKPAPGASISTKTVKGKRFLYAVTPRAAGARAQLYLGPADDPAIAAEADRLKAAAKAAKDRRSLVSTLKLKAKVAGPTPIVGRVLAALASEGLFERGLLLVGTVAYQLYPFVIGYRLSSSALMTQDIDLNVVELARGPEADLLEVLQRADTRFAPQMNRNQARALPTVYVLGHELQVDVLSRLGRKSSAHVEVPQLHTGAMGLAFQEYLSEDTVAAVALHETGVLARVPAPARYAVHKLLVASRRDAAPKRMKDLVQARELMCILRRNEPHNLEAAMEDARGRGRAWRTALDASFAALERI